MGNDPKTSVVNRYCQVHDVDNLFVVDGSVHVTNGGFNPVLTIMAIAYYASAHLVEGWKGTRFRRLRTASKSRDKILLDRAVMTHFAMNRTYVDTEQPRPRFRKLLLIGLLVALLSLPGGSLYYEYSQGKACARCHEIWQPYTDWHTSAHRNVPCSACHGDVFTLETRFHWNNIRRLANHLRGDVPEQVRLKTTDALQVSERCRNCHEEEYADWAASSHSATYAEIFLDKKHNRQELLMDDCLRCHGMHFEGGIRDLVSPVNTTGPWRLWKPELANRPAIPCLTCHQMHREGLPLIRPAVKPTNASPTEEINRPSLALFDRRELEHVSVRAFPCPRCTKGCGPSKSVRTLARRFATSVMRRFPLSKSVPEMTARPSACTKG